ncbi:MAG: sulfotransferase family 2 domain-containing protein [Steroidobacteraceae bacterium]
MSQGPWFELKRGVLKHVNAWRGRIVFIHINKTAGTSVERALHLRSERKTALQKREEMGRQRFERAFKFAFVRNPWDKVLSHYHYRMRTNRTGLADAGLDFRTWVLKAYGERDPRWHDDPRMFMAQRLWLDDDAGRCLVDFVGRFERLEQDFGEACRRMGVQATLPHVKVTRHAPYREAYDDETRALVARVFAADLEAFGFEF